MIYKGVKKLYNSKIDLSGVDGEDIINYLHSIGIMERGKILSPDKSIWFKVWHYIEFKYLAAKKTKTYYHQWFYNHCAADQRIEGELLNNLTFEELKQITKNINYTIITI